MSGSGVGQSGFGGHERSSPTHLPFILKLVTDSRVVMNRETILVWVVTLYVSVLCRSQELMSEVRNQYPVTILRPYGAPRIPIHSNDNRKKEEKKKGAKKKGRKRSRRITYVRF